MVLGKVAAAPQARREISRSGLFNICETINLYYNGLISVLCREKNFARQGLVVFCRHMNRLILTIILFAAPAVFAAEKPKAQAKTITVEDEALKSARRAAMAEIAAAEKKPGAAAALKAKLSDNDPLVRGEAARALGGTKASGALEELTAGLGNSDKHTRWGAAEGLARLGDKRAVPALIGALAHQERNTRWKAAQALGDLKDARAVDPLITAARSDKDRNVRMAAIEALLKTGGTGARAALNDLSSDPDQEVKAWAAAAAAKLR